MLGKVGVFGGEIVGEKPFFRVYVKIFHVVRYASRTQPIDPEVCGTVPEQIGRILNKSERSRRRPGRKVSDPERIRKED